MSARTDTCLLYFPAYRQDVTGLATALGVDCHAIDVHRFPDQEALVTLPAFSTRQVIVYLSLDHPDQKLIELLLACTTLRESGVQSIILTCPYLCYMRQDIAFHAGQAVSQKIIGRFLAALADVVVTVDPHLHRTPTLAEAVPARQTLALSSASSQAAYVRQHYADAILVGPDQESEQWVAGIAAEAGLEFCIAHKHRLGDRSVQIDLPAIDFSGRRALLIDDIASTGHTLATCARRLGEAGAGTVDALVTHALFDEGAEQQMTQAGIATILSTDSVEHHSNRISLTSLLAQSLRALI